MNDFEKTQRHSILAPAGQSFQGQISQPAPKPTPIIDLMVEAVGRMQKLMNEDIEALNQMHMRALGQPLSCLSEIAEAPRASDNHKGDPNARQGSAIALKLALAQLEGRIALAGRALSELEQLA